MESTTFIEHLADLGAWDRLSGLSGLEARQAAELVVAMIPESTSSPWSELLGPVYRWQSIAKVLGVGNRQSVDHARKTHRVLGIKTDDGHWAYPAFQVGRCPGGVRIVAGLAEVLELLVPETDGLSAAWWLATPNRKFDGRRPIDELASARHSVISAAREQADIWAGRARA
ncbi:MAG TPA: hypothetical protein VNQ73_08625 [Ilumatobacter sp.]|nr:hypothetical protein [Ilumatobacter sp.]